MAESLTIARPYAKALFEIAVKGNLKEWQSIMEICTLFSKDNIAKKYLASYKGSANSLYDFFESIFEKSGVSSSPKEFKGFLSLLIKNDRVELIPDISQLFIKEANKSNNILLATITSAMPISDSEKDIIVTNLSKKFGKKIEAVVTIDEALIGGIIIKVGNSIIDGTIKGRLEQLSKALI